MKGIPKEAVITKEQMTAIPEALRDQALALTQAVEAAPGVSIAIMFHVEGGQASDGVPLMLAGDLRALTAQLLGVAAGLAAQQGMESADGECSCAACTARRAGKAVKA